MMDAHSLHEELNKRLAEGTGTAFPKGAKTKRGKKSKVVPSGTSSDFERLHPRGKAGTSQGGKFVAKEDLMLEKPAKDSGGSSGSSGSGGGSTDAKDKAKEERQARRAENKLVAEERAKTQAHLQDNADAIKGWEQPEGMKFKAPDPNEIMSKGLPVGNKRFKSVAELSKFLERGGSSFEEFKQSYPRAAKALLAADWNRQPDAKRLAAYKAGKQPKELGENWTFFEDGSVKWTPGKGKKSSTKTAREPFGGPDDGRPVVKAFQERLHPRDDHGRFRTVRDIFLTDATRYHDRMYHMREIAGGTKISRERARAAGEADAREVIGRGLRDDELRDLFDSYTNAGHLTHDHHQKLRATAARAVVLEEMQRRKLIFQPGGSKYRGERRPHRLSKAAYAIDIEIDLLKRFNPGQPRDFMGRWTDDLSSMPDPFMALRALGTRSHHGGPGLTTRGGGGSVDRDMGMGDGIEPGMIRVEVATGVQGEEPNVAYAPDEASALAAAAQLQEDEYRRFGGAFGPRRVRLFDNDSDKVLLQIERRITAQDYNPRKEKS